MDYCTKTYKIALVLIKGSSVIVPEKLFIWGRYLMTALRKDRLSFVCKETSLMWIKLVKN